jgi:hypothetical protein
MKLGGKRTYQTTAEVEARYGAPVGGAPQLHDTRTGPLTTSQHILHLLLTVFTAGLWLPVWIWLAIRGNREARPG